MSIIQSGSSGAAFIVNAQMLGGVVTGSNGAFARFPIKGTDLLPGGAAPSTEVALQAGFTGSTIIGHLNQLFDSSVANNPGGANTNIQFNDDGDFGGLSTFTTDGTDLTLTSDNKLNVRDTGIFIQSLENGHLGLTADVLISLTGAVKTSADLVIGTNLGMTGSIAGATTIAASGLASVGGVAVDNAGNIGTDSDTDMLTLNNGSDVTVASDLQLRFRDSGLHIQSLEDGHLGLTADKLISLTGAVKTSADLVIGTNLGMTGSIAGATTIVASSTITGASGSFGAIGATTVNGSGAGTFGGVVTGASGSFGAIGATTIAGSGKLTIDGVSDLDGGIDVNASKFTVSTAGAVVADSSISGAAGNFDALTGVSLDVQSGGIANAGNILGAVNISASNVITADAMSLAAGDFSVTNAGAIAGASLVAVGAVQGSSLTDGTATIVGGVGSGISQLLAPSGSAMTLGMALQGGSSGLFLTGLTASAGTVLGFASRNSVLGDFAFGGQSIFQGNPTALVPGVGGFQQSHPALVVSASIQGAGLQASGSANANVFGTIPFLQLQGQNAAGAVKDFKVQISGGILKVSEVT